jgi:hypothetical protein
MTRCRCDLAGESNGIRRCVATRNDALILTIKSDRDLKNGRVTKHERASANRWHLEVRLAAPSDVDHELKAYALAS